VLLYYITDRTQFPGDEKARQLALLDKIAEATQCGVDFIQLREKDLPAGELEILCREAVRIVRTQPNEDRKSITRLLINSRTDVALACDAEGVHLRSDDISPSQVRSLWARAGCPSRTLVGVSCHSVADVARAASERADFAVFAPVFEKKDAAHAHPAGLSGLREACQRGIPVVALGGVTLKNARSCRDAGVAGVAGIRLFQANDIAEVVRQLRT
jgi:thiamine-phosphate pyrophosphorylase